MQIAITGAFLLTCLSLHPAAAQTGWDCTLHSPKGDGDVAFHIRKQDNGYYGDGVGNFFMVVQDSDYDFVGARSGSGVSGFDSNNELIGVNTLTIDKKTNLARYAVTYLKGYRDTDFYGFCIPDKG
jgi:hypothetical protein